MHYQNPYLLPVKAVRKSAAQIALDARNERRAKEDEIFEMLNRLFRLMARQANFPRNCRYKKCRTSSACQSEHPLGINCGTMNAPESFYYDLIDNLDLMMNVTGPLKSDAFVDNRKDLREVIHDLIKLSKTMKHVLKRDVAMPW
jgi:hypothetical protein